MNQVNQIKRTVAAHYDEFGNHFGFGPCGAVSVVLRERGLGQIVYAEANDNPANEAGWFGHYLIRSRGKLVDATNPFAGPLFYRDVEDFRGDELPELVAANGAEVNFWRELL